MKKQAWDNVLQMHLKSAKPKHTACGKELTSKVRSTYARRSVTCGDCKEIMNKKLTPSTASSRLVEVDATSIILMATVLVEQAQALLETTGDKDSGPFEG